jgi:3-oxoacyl-[acyl-carrier-protein] synthase II
MKERYVITGMGIVSPIGCSTGAFWKSLQLAPEEAEEYIASSPTEKAPSAAVHDSGVGLITEVQNKVCPRVRRVRSEQLQGLISARQAKKIDKFSLFALEAFLQTKEAAGLTSNENICMNSGLFIGNSTGGWEYVEHQLYGLYSKSIEEINPYVATAWFPTAAQGEISINEGIAGYSKTLSAGNASVGYALQHALLCLDTSQVKAAFVMGCEAPLTPLVINACLSEGHVSTDGKYHPFTPSASGNALGEGACSFLIESASQAQARKAPILAKVRAVTYGYSLLDSVQKCLSAAEVNACDIDLCVLEGCAESELDAIEQDLIENFLEKPLSLTPAAHTGTVLATDFAYRLATAVLCMKNQGTSLHMGNRLDSLLRESRRTSLKYALTYGCDPQGRCVSVILENPN